MNNKRTTRTTVTTVTKNEQQQQHQVQNHAKEGKLMSRTDKSMNNARKATTNKENIEKQQCKSEEKQEKLSKN